MTAANCDLLNPAVTLPSSTSTSSSTVSPCIQLFPPLHGTDYTSYTAPLIIPTLAGASSSEGSVATNPVTAASIPVKSSVSEALELDVPEFEDDEQMFHYVVMRLQRALKDCQSTADVSIISHLGSLMYQFKLLFCVSFRVQIISSTVVSIELLVQYDAMQCAVFNVTSLVFCVGHTQNYCRTTKLPLLSFGLRVCPLTKTDVRSLDFIINRFL